MYFEKLLVANRGEISCRVFRACRDLGIVSVAVYSDADSGALHVREADEAYGIGGASASESYLNIPAIVSAIRASGADAVHPGYGFLSESAAFARAVQETGATWVGPGPEAMEAMGLKVRAKEIAARAGVPTVPGYDGGDQSLERLSEEADRIGYPVLVKASAGGGGRGMREVRDASRLPEAVRSARSEAESAFSDGTVFVEKLVERPRHIEVQVMADHHGNVVHLYERECSIQRRHQKVVEEAPSPALSGRLREEICAAAVSLASEVGYTNAGTVEFLLSGEDFYFLEMNARLQVEHPVTEEVTGLDLVKLQLEVAAGEELSVTQGEIRHEGSAIEVRIYAEDERGFPDGGRLLAFDPPSGVGIRNDSGVRTGDTVSLSYDSMISKLIVHAPNRLQTVERLTDALARYTVVGPATNIPLLKRIAANEDFIAGETATDFLERHALIPSEDEPNLTPPPDVLAAVAVADAGADLSKDPFEVGPWRALGRSRLSYVCGDGVERVEMYRDGEGIRVEVGEERFEAELLTVVGDVSYLVLSGEDYRVEAGDGCLRVEDGARSHEVRRRPPPEVSATGVASSGAGLKAPMPGTVAKVMVEEGEEVEEGQTLLVLEAMKMEYPILAPVSGTVREIPFKAGELVASGVTLLEIDPTAT